MPERRKPFLKGEHGWLYPAHPTARAECHMRLYVTVIVERVSRDEVDVTLPDGREITVHSDELRRTPPRDRKPAKRTRREAIAPEFGTELSLLDGAE